MNRKEMLVLQSKVAQAIRSAAITTGNDRELESLIGVIVCQEKEHRAFGKRLVGSQATKRHAPISAAADHFLCRTIFQGIETYRQGDAPIATLRRVREDFVRAAILCSDEKFVTAVLLEIEHAKISEDSPRSTLRRVAELDYCEVIAS